MNPQSHSESLPLLTIKQSCREMNISRTRLYELCRAGVIRTVDIGARGKRIPREELLRFVEEGSGGH